MQNDVTHSLQAMAKLSSNSGNSGNSGNRSNPVTVLL
jgi:hypothetical protein